MTVTCIIPARKNSSRFPGKLLTKVNDKTILEHTYEKAILCKQIDALYVATDDEDIANIVLKQKGQVLWTSSSCQNGTERICQALERYPHLMESKYIVNLQADHPLTEPSTISAMLNALDGDSKASMATAVTRLKAVDDYLSPHVVKCVFDNLNRALYFSRSPIPYQKMDEKLNAFGHIGIYAYKPAFLKEIFTKETSFLQKIEDLEQLKVLENGHSIKIAVVEEMILGIDTPKDLEKFKELLCLSNLSL